jgi:tRNA G18 (ribose-2'-O)-methylase SpoU
MLFLNKIEIVELILKYKANINAKTTIENTSLYVCCEHINSSSNIGIIIRK